MTEILFARVDDVDASAAIAASAAAQAAQAAAEAAAASLTTEVLQDLVGAMFSGNTETRIEVTYQDSDGTIDLVVDNDLANYSNATSQFLNQAAADALYVAIGDAFTEAAADALYQPLSAELTALAGLTTAAGGRTALELADPGDDRLMAWDESSGRIKFFQEADFQDEPIPDDADYIMAYSDNRLVKIPYSAFGVGATGPQGPQGDPGADGAATFLELTDAPDSYTGEGGKAVIVKMTEDGLEFGTASAVATLDDLTDVVITTPADNEVLAYDNGSGDWINQTAAEAGLAAASHTHTTADITDYTEVTQDTVGAMLSGNTETLITVTYQDADGTIDFVVDNDLANYSNASSGFLTAATADALFLTPAEGNAAYQPLDADLTSWAGITRAAGFDTFVATPSVANFSSLLTGETFALDDAELGAIAGLVSAADRLPYFTGSGTASLATFTAYGRTLVALADEDALEALLDTLPNVTSIQGRTVTLADAGADAFLIWDDSASAYQNASAADAFAIISANIAAAYQPLDADLTTLSTAFTTASASGAASLAFHEDTDNGTNRVLLQGAASTADVTVTLPAATCTLVGKDTSDILTNKTFDANGSGNSISNIETPDIAAATLVTAADTVAGNDNDTTWPTTAAIIDYAQPLDADLTAIAALTTAAAGRGLLTLADPNLDAFPFWDDSAGTVKWSALADLNTEAAPAAGDYLMLVDSGGNLLKVNWSSLPGVGGGISNVVEDVTPQLGGDLDLLGQGFFDSTNPSNVLFDLGTADFASLTITNSSAATGGPILTLYQNSATPAADDNVGSLYFQGEDSAGNTQNYAWIEGYISDTTSTSEDGRLAFNVISGGSTLTALTLMDPTLAGHTFNLGSTGSFYTVTAKSTYAGTYGSYFTTFHDSATPAASDNIGGIIFSGRDSAANQQDYAVINAYITDPTSTSEAGRLDFNVYSGGSALTALTLGSAYPFAKFDVGSSTFEAMEVWGSASDGGGPFIAVRHNSASPAAGDQFGYGFRGNDNAGNNTLYASVWAEPLDTTNTSEDGVLKIGTMVAGTSPTVQASFSNGVTIGSTDAAPGAGNLALYSADGGATGPSITLDHDSATPAANDAVGTISFSGEDSAGNDETYGSITTYINDATSTAEDSRMEFKIRSGGSTVTPLYINEGPKVGFDGTQGDYIIFDHGSGRPYWYVVQNSAPGTPQDVFYMDFWNNAEDQRLGRLRFTTTDPTDASEDTQFTFDTCVAGVNATRMTIGNTVDVVGDINSTGDVEGATVHVTTNADFNGLHIDHSADGAAGPWVSTWHNSGSPAAGDALYVHSASGNDSALNFQGYGAVQLEIVDPTNTSEDSRWFWQTYVAGSATTQLQLSNGVTIGSGTDSFPGNGNLRVGNIEIGHDTDTTLARAAAGRLTVEGVELLRPAAQADQETGTSNILGVTPGTQHFHPSAAKFWVYWTGNSTTILRSYNMTSIANTGTGDADGTIANDFSDANWAGFVNTNDATNAWDNEEVQSSGFNARAAGTFGVLCSTVTDGTTAATSLTNPDQWQVVGFGDL